MVKLISVFAMISTLPVWNTVPSARAIAVDTLVPYTVRLVQRMQGPTPGSTVTLVFTTAQRSDGAQVKIREMFGPDGRLRSSERTVELISGTVASFDLTSKLRTTTFDPTRKWRDYIRDPRRNCLKSLSGTALAATETELGKDRVDRFAVIRVTDSGNALWLAPALGCAVLKAQYGPNERLADTIVAAEPSAELFEVSGAFREVPPSQFFHLSPGKATTERDTFYHSHRPR